MYSMMFLKIRHSESKKRFTEGGEEVNDDASPGRHHTSTTDESVEILKKSC